MDFARAQSAFRETEESHASAAATVTLENINFRTARQIERDLTDDLSTAIAPIDTVQDQAVKAAAMLFPDTSLQLLSIDQTNSFSYASFEQTYESRPVVSARLQLRMTPAGDWVTANSNLVSPALMAPLTNLSDLAQKKIDSGRYFVQPHQILKERSVIYPRSNNDGSATIFAAREFSVFDLNNHLEFIFWVDEASLEPVAGFQPSTHLGPLTVKGSIVPNAPEDKTTEVFFPFVTVLGGKTKISADENGVINPFLGLGQVKLENDYLVVVNNENGKSSLDVNFESVESSDLSLNAGPILEERNIYHWIMHTKKFLKDEFNFTKQSSKMVAIARFGIDLDNAFFMPLTYSLSFGTGKKFLKNTALARDIIIHEFGHSVVYEKFGMVGGYEFSAMNEAMADYLAAIVTNEPRIAEGAIRPTVIIDENGERTIQDPYLRTVENKMRYPQDFSGDYFHEDGQIFSGALWDMRKTLGSKVADALIHEAQMGAPKTIFEFYRELLKVDELKDDRNPYTPSKNETAIRRAFFKHGIGSRDVVFKQGEIKDLTEPWKPGCWITAQR